MSFEDGVFYSRHFGPENKRTQIKKKKTLSKFITYFQDQNDMKKTSSILIIHNGDSVFQDKSDLSNRGAWPSVHSICPRFRIGLSSEK